MPANVPTVSRALEDGAPGPTAKVPTTEPVPITRSIVVARRMAYLLLGAQLVVMLGFSTLLYHRYDLTRDYAQYAQAWYAIAHGHWNPYDSVLHFSFWTNEGEFVLWPLALLYFVFPHAIDLLWVQDLAVFATELVALLWIVDVLDQTRPRLNTRTTAIATVAVAVVIVADPWAYETIAFDFHTHPLAAFFVVLAGRALWSNRHRKLVWWVLSALICNALAGLWIAAVGVSGILSGHGRRRSGAVMIVVGVAWTAVLSSASGHFGGNVDTNFGYLLHNPPTHVGLLSVASGALDHPGAVIAHLADRWKYLFIYLIPLGFVGIFSVWALPIVAAVFLPSMLAGSVLFLRLNASFQQWPALPFVLVGSVMVLATIRQRRISPRLVRVTTAFWAAMLTVIAALVLPSIPAYWVADTPAAATVLARLHATIAPTAEVVASQGICGRFADRADIECFINPPQSIPTTARTVVFIMTASQGVGEVSSAEIHAAVAVIERLGARQIVNRAGIDAFTWYPHHQWRIVLP